MGLGLQGATDAGIEKVLTVELATFLTLRANALFFAASCKILYKLIWHGIIWGFTGQ